ncbi:MULTISPECIES: GntR family transcriptional regulator [Novosphingobium]|uniref:Transcriptional regulator, GntR family n=1 Tax=Novosphingobium mathurense TaxID=428990 RepID=A0A1U6GRW8_9SPHN|nr:MULTISPECIES: GntR family transcriptional regulator [Novosphingobium]CDO36947.1 histidine utilization repressor, transcriptional regulatory protein GntR family [Novosphingobium sp. KN65.2]SLJ86283.1 transcriptional regulator, GntR family [Novosphingobium mathurense]
MTLPLGERIRAEVEARIVSGELSPGERLPTEAELMAHYACSRMTVNKALSALAAAGLIERRKRAGSFVSRPRVHSMVLDIPDLAEEIAARGQRHQYRLRKREITEGPDSPFGPDRGRVLSLAGVHYANDAAFAVEHRQVDLTAVPDIEFVDFAEQAPGSWLLRHVPWDEAETRIAAEGADAEVASWMMVAPGTATLLVERRTWRGKDSITFVRQHFRGDLYDLVARFGQSGARRS